MMNQLDRQLAAYCSPTLAGIKPASLVSFDRELYLDLPQRLKTLDGVVKDVEKTERGYYVIVEFDEDPVEE